MYDMILGYAGDAVWMKGGTGIVIHREYSRGLPGVANTSGPLTVFDYRQGQTGPGALVALTGGVANVANEWDTSIKEANRMNETFWATHLRISVQRVTQDSALATDRVLAVADYRMLTSRTFFKFYHMKEDLPEVQGTLEEFPEAMGPELESVGTNFFTANNGPSHFGAAKPLPKPLFFAARSTYVSGTFTFGTNRGGITLAGAAPGVGLMVYVDGYRSPKPEELAQARG
jgi:hypothetical protein